MYDILIDIINNNGEVAKRLNAADCKSVPFGSWVRIPLSPFIIMGFSSVW